MLVAVNFLTVYLTYRDENVKVHAALGLLSNGNEFINELSRSFKSDYEVSRTIIQSSKFSAPSRSENRC